MKLHEASALHNQSNFWLLWWQDCRQIMGLQRRTCWTPAHPGPSTSPSHLLAFGVAGGGVGLRVVLPLEGALKGLEVVLAEGVRAEVLARPAAAALGVDAQPAAVLVTWSPRAGRKLSGDTSPHFQARVEEQTELPRVGKDPGPWPPGLRAVAAQRQATGYREVIAKITHSWAQGGFWPIRA